MFGIDGGEFVVLALLALFLLGPERLPGLAKQAARALHDVRRWTQRTRADIGRELGPEFENFDLADLNPKRFVQKHLLDPLEDDDEDEDSPAKPAKPAKQLEPRSSPTYGHAALRSQTGTDGGDAVSLLKSPAAGGSDAAEVTIGPAFTTDLFAAPAGAALALAPAPARSTVTVPAWGDTASAREAGDSFDPDLDTGFDFDADSELDDDSEAGSDIDYDQSDLDTDEDDSTSWEHSLTAFYLPPPFDMDAT